MYHFLHVVDMYIHNTVVNTTTSTLLFESTSSSHSFHHLTHHVSLSFFFPPLFVLSWFYVVSLSTEQEFNAGKSEFLNSLLGTRECATGILPTTERITILRYGRQKEIYTAAEQEEAITSVYLPIPWLLEMNIVDTPGTNAILREHEQLTTSFLPRADFILFITSPERPFSESEKNFLKQIIQYKKKIVILLNKVDLFQKNEKDLLKVLDFVRTHAKQGKI
jgi:small GTP-binding protein